MRLLPSGFHSSRQGLGVNAILDSHKESELHNVGILVIGIGCECFAVGVEVPC